MARVISMMTRPNRAQLRPGLASIVDGRQTKWGPVQSAPKRLSDSSLCVECGPVSRRISQGGKVTDKTNRRREINTRRETFNQLVAELPVQ